MTEGPAPWLDVNLSAQKLTLWRGNGRRTSYPVSTGAAPPCERDGSGGTPRGWHRVRARIGAGAPRGAVFIARRPTGEVWSRDLQARYPNRDWVLTRILWLVGEERGFNRLGDVDTQRRYIYIHGTPDDEPLGVPGSHGCIRMANRAIETLCDEVPIGTPVWIGHAPPDRPRPSPLGART